MQSTVGAAPTNANFQARWGAIVQLAVFEAVNHVGAFKVHCRNQSRVTVSRICIPNSRVQTAKFIANC
jgi:hypothetical protein